MFGPSAVAAWFIHVGQMLISVSEETRKSKPPLRPKNKHLFADEDERLIQVSSPLRPRETELLKVAKESIWKISALGSSLIPGTTLELILQCYFIAGWVPCWLKEGLTRKHEVFWKIIDCVYSKEHNAWREVDLFEVATYGKDMKKCWTDQRNVFREGDHLGHERQMFSVIVLSLKPVPLILKFILLKCIFEEYEVSLDTTLAIAWQYTLFDCRRTFPVRKRWYHRMKKPRVRKEEQILQCVYFKLTRWSEFTTASLISLKLFSYAKVKLFIRRTPQAFDHAFRVAQYHLSSPPLHLVTWTDLHVLCATLSLKDAIFEVSWAETAKRSEHAWTSLINKFFPKRSTERVMLSSKW